MGFSQRHPLNLALPSLEFLAFYRALFERSCDAINALALALNARYVRRGYRMTNHKVRTFL